MRKLQNDELKRLSVEEFKKEKKTPIIVVLDNVRSLNNIGSVFRTADAFCLAGVHLCGITDCPPHREIQKTALGATDSVAWKYYGETEQSVVDLRSEGYKVYAVEQTDKSVSLSDFRIKPGEKTAVIFGNEIRGVSENILSIADGCIEVPQYGTKHSLNISVCAGIVIWHLFSC